MSSDPLLALRFEHFVGLVDTDLPIDLGGGPVAARVVTVERVGGYTTRLGGGFSVVLKVPISGAPAQGTFPGELPEFGTVGIFMSPRRLQDAAALYELIFN